MITSIRPPIVSIPSERGVTSSRRMSFRFPARISAWIAAPRATTSSGLISSCAGRPKNSAIRRFTSGVLVEPPTITTYAGTGEPGLSGDGGPALEATLYHPHDLEIGPEGDLYVADTNNGVIRAISKADGTIRTVAGTGELGLNEEEGLLATETIFRRPFGIEFDAAGNLYVSDTINSRVVRIAR